jgi:hypothetical protein
MLLCSALPLTLRSALCLLSISFCFRAAAALPATAAIITSCLRDTAVPDDLAAPAAHPMTLLFLSCSVPLFALLCFLSG